MFNRVRYNKTRFDRTVILTGTVPVSPITKLEPAIVAALKGSLELAAICGNRVYPSRIPQKSLLPALTYQVSSADRVVRLRGAAGFRRVSIKFECRSLIKADNRDAREVIRKLFQGYNGKLGQVRIKFISLDKESDSYEQPTPGSDDGTFTKIFSFQFALRDRVRMFV